MTQPLLDPQLVALYAADPANFLEQGLPAAEHDPSTPPIERIGIELAAAFLVVRGLAAKFLAAQDPRLGEVPVVAGQAWRHHAPLWLRMAVPAIRQAYSLGQVDGLSEAELQELAAEYASTLGDYLDQSSAEAITQGFTQQLNARWNEQLAWHRASAAYGLDSQQMRSYIASLITPGETPGVDPIPTGSRLMIDKLLLSRAQVLGETEAWRSMESGKAIAWMVLQQRGVLPAGTLREWDNRNEQACQTCRALHRQRVPLTEPFVHPVSGNLLWAPGAHPWCKCEVRLVLPLSSLGKALGKDPYDRDKHGRFAATEHRAGRPVRVAESVQDPAVAAILRQVRDLHPVTAQPTDLFASPYGGQPKDLFASPPDLFARPRDPFGVAREPARSLFDRQKAGRTRPGHDRPKRVIHHVAVPTRLPGEVKERGHEPYYLPVEELHNAYEESNGEVLWDPGDWLDFTEANNNLRNYVSYFDDGVEVLQTVFAVRSDNPMELTDREQPDVSIADTGRLWAELLPNLRSAHQQAIAHADDLVERLGSHDLRDIFRMAGYDFREDPNVMRARIVRAAHGRDGGDDSLAGAYADHVAWQEPELLGELGTEIRRALDEAEHAEIFVFGPEHNQFFAFENGFHDGSEHRSLGRVVDLHSDYIATHATYHSALMEAGTAAKPFVVGWREISLVPADEHGRRLPRDLDVGWRLPRSE